MIAGWARSCSFSAPARISEAEALSRRGQDLMDRVEQFPKPIVACQSVSDTHNGDVAARMHYLDSNRALHVLSVEIITDLTGRE